MPGPAVERVPVEQRSTSPLPRSASPALPAAAAGGDAQREVQPLDAGPAPQAAERGPARWVEASWSELPGLAADRSAELWPALLAGCTRPAPGWAELCARVLLEPAPTGHEAVRSWLAAQLQPWRLESSGGSATGLATGYFEPTITASRRPRAGYRVPLHAPPPALATAQAARRPFFTRQQLDSPGPGAASLRGHEIAWVEDPLDALLLQIQGSGRLRIVEPDGRILLVRLAFAAHNDQPYRSVGRWLIEQGELAADGASWPAIKAWAQRNPRRVSELLWTNPRVVFFREEPLADPTLGPRGAMGVPLTPGRSVAVDPRVVPHGTVLWLDTTEPLGSRPLQRLAIAQDSGGAITGAVRIDLFFGWAGDAEAQAGRMKQPLRLWALWPRGMLPPASP